MSKAACDARALARDLWDRAKTIHKPDTLAEAWAWRKNPNPSVAAFVEALRVAVQSRGLDDPETAPAYVARLMEVFVGMFERLLEAGKFVDVLPRLAALPLLYSPRAGKGAPNWARAFKLFTGSGVGRDTLLEYRGNDSNVIRNPTWGLLASDAMLVVESAALNFPRFRELRGQATPAISYSRKRNDGAKKEMRGEVFILPGNELLWWPDWLDLCGAIPRRPLPDGRLVRVSEAEDAYQKAVRAVLDDFFADPTHPYADEIVKPMMSAKDSRAVAVKEARRNVLDAVRRMM